MQAASEVRTLSGLGENFEVILKFSSFEPGEEVPLTAYVLDSITNEPIKGAAISGGLSSGNASVSVVFKEAAHGLPGAYESKVRVLSDKPYSWLFDISLGEKSDLVAIDGFKAGKQDKGAPHPAAKEADYAVKLTPAMVTVVAVAFALLQAAILFFVRRRLSPRTPAKDLQ
ncbi:MAG: hypothetical protein Q7U02_15820 [Desulfosalsimonadaceae bacterium]|nr:hypothetical protein [Desulfosalsimonadaceae bacterium]